MEVHVLRNLLPGRMHSTNEVSTAIRCPTIRKLTTQVFILVGINQRNSDYINNIFKLKARNPILSINNSVMELELI